VFLVSGEVPTYSITVTCDDLEAMKPVLHRVGICQHRAFDAHFQRKLLGIEIRLTRRGWVALSLAGALLSTLLLAMTREDELFGRAFLGSLATFFWLVFAAALVLGPDRIKATIEKRFTHPLIRRTVNRSLDQSLKLAPLSVVYRFFETSYTASSPELKSERTISGDEISVAYQTESAFCLFEKKTSQSLKAIVYAPEPEQRKVVEAFLKRNQVEICGEIVATRQQAK